MGYLEVGEGEGVVYVVSDAKFFSFSKGVVYVVSDAKFFSFSKGVVYVVSDAKFFSFIKGVVYVVSDAKFFSFSKGVVYVVSDAKFFSFSKGVAFLMTGGGSGDTRQSTEIYNPSIDLGCSLPNLPDRRIYHTQSENLLCGGWDGSNRVSICWTWDSKSGAWTQTHSLNTGRNKHVAWPTPSGVYLLGGSTDDDGTTDTVELVTENNGILDATFKYEV